MLLEENVEKCFYNLGSIIMTWRSRGERERVGEEKGEGERGRKRLRDLVTRSVKLC
jgi:hypothetical protein